MRDIPSVKIYEVEMIFKKPPQLSLTVKAYTARQARLIATQESESMGFFGLNKMTVTEKQEAAECDCEPE